MLTLFICSGATRNKLWGRGGTMGFFKISYPVNTFSLTFSLSDIGRFTCLGGGTGPRAAPPLIAPLVIFNNINKLLIDCWCMFDNQKGFPKKGCMSNSISSRLNANADITLCCSTLYWVMHMAKLTFNRYI